MSISYLWKSLQSVKLVLGHLNRQVAVILKKSKITLILYGVFSNFFLKLPGKMKIYSFSKRCVI